MNVVDAFFHGNNFEIVQKENPLLNTNQSLDICLLFP